MQSNKPLKSQRAIQAAVIDPSKTNLGSLGVALVKAARNL